MFRMNGIAGCAERVQHLLLVMPHFPPLCTLETHWNYIPRTFRILKRLTTTTHSMTLRRGLCLEGSATQMHSLCLQPCKNLPTTTKQYKTVKLNAQEENHMHDKEKKHKDHPAVCFGCIAQSPSATWMPLLLASSSHACETAYANRHIVQRNHPLQVAQS